MHSSSRDSSEEIVVSVRDGIAVVTLNIPKKLNALSLPLYKKLATTLQSLDAREDTFITLLTGSGRFFSAGADVQFPRDATAEDDTIRSTYIRRLSEGNLDLVRALSTHSKLLVVGMNGPAVGLSAAFIGWADFVYAVESAWILTPFSSLSLVAEGGASLTFPRRMGISKANEVLIMGKKMSASEMLNCGFVNKLFPQSTDDVFLASLLAYLQDKFSDLDRDSLLITKRLIQQSLVGADLANVREMFEGANRFATGKPQAQFARLAAKTKKHKL